MTHKQRVLHLLSDGRPHSHLEGYQLGVMLHSRVADLRADGHEIACWRYGDLYLYRLLGTADTVAAVSAVPSGPGDPGVDGTAQTDGQLTLTGAPFRRAVA